MNFDIISRKVTNMHSNNNSKKIEFDSYFELLKDKEILNCLEKEFNGRKRIFEYELDNIKDYRARRLVEMYIDENDIEIVYVKSNNNISNSILSYYNDIGRVKLLTRDEEIELAKKIQKGDINAKNELIERNLKLVVSVAKRYVYTGVDLADLISEGNLGLIEAAGKFDPNKGFKFSTYAIWWIKQSISRHVSNNSRTIRIPVHAYEKLKKIAYLISKYETLNGKKPSDEYIANEMNMNLEDYKKFIMKTQDCISLDDTVGEVEHGEVIRMIDFIKDDNVTAQVEEYTIFKQYRKIIIEILDELLTEREKNILLFRYGFIDDNVHTLEELAHIYGITRERVRQIEARSIAKIKRKSGDRLREIFEN